jgi:hypothetical protein
MRSLKARLKPTKTVVRTGGCVDGNVEKEREREKERKLREEGTWLDYYTLWELYADVYVIASFNFFYFLFLFVFNIPFNIPPLSIYSLSVFSSSVFLKLCLSSDFLVTITWLHSLSAVELMNLRDLKWVIP